jgi:hypothetical protein
MKCRSRVTYLSSSFNRSCRRHLIFLAIHWYRIESDNFDFAAPICNSLHHMVYSCVFLVSMVLHFNTYSCDEQRYTHLKLICLQPIEWRILHFFGILRFPNWTEILQSAIHFSSNFDEEVFDISFFRRFHFRGLRKTTLPSLRYSQFLALAGLYCKWVLSVLLSCPF